MSKRNLFDRVVDNNEESPGNPFLDLSDGDEHPVIYRGRSDLAISADEKAAIATAITVVKRASRHIEDNISVIMHATDVVPEVIRLGMFSSFLDNMVFIDNIAFMLQRIHDHLRIDILIDDDIARSMRTLDAAKPISDAEVTHDLGDS